MKIMVILKDGKQELLDLPNGTQWTVADETHMSCLRGAHGFDHYFNYDGTYDGWGGHVSCPSATAKELITAQEEARHYTGAGGRKA